MAQPLIERFRERLPLEPDDPVVSLGEGSTPLIEAPVISERVGARVLLKLEGANPTGSFKDRGMTVAVSRARGAGAEAVICASTGNTAASAAAYAARAGLRGAVIVPGGKIPVGNAGNISAWWRGFGEYTVAPLLYGFQAEGAAPLVRGAPVASPETIA